MTLEQEILNAMASMGYPYERTSGSIARYIEEHSPPVAWRFLWWHGEHERVIPFGTLHRALDRLTDSGKLIRREHGVDSRPAFTYVLVQ